MKWLGCIFFIILTAKGIVNNNTRKHKVKNKLSPMLLFLNHEKKCNNLSDIISCTLINKGWSHDDRNTVSCDKYFLKAYTSELSFLHN
jgi:hypothetical protein